MKKKVVLFYPRYPAPEVAPPLALLAISAPLVKEGYEVKIVDANVDDNFQQLILKEVGDAIFLGISLVTGPMVLDTMSVGRKVKEIYPRIPIVLGGWHPSLFPETINEDFVDVVVKGQGEATVMELVRAFETGGSLENIKGISFKKNGKAVHNQRRDYIDVNQLPPKPYEITDPERYFAKSGTRWVRYYTSCGCPYNCTYCCNHAVYGGKWNGLKPERVVEEVSNLVKRFRIDCIGFTDDNFFASEKRIHDIANGFIKNGTQFKWYAFGRGDRIAKYKEETLKRMVESGCYQILFGAESGSKKVLALMNKNENNEDILISAERCRKWGITSGFCFIFGYPGETEEDIYDTLNLIEQIKACNPDATIYPGIFTPYPGSPAWEHAVKYGIEAPKTFNGWAKFDPVRASLALPWLSPTEMKKLVRIKRYVAIGFSSSFDKELKKGKGTLSIKNLFVLLAQQRIKEGFFYFPFELWIRKLFSIKGEIFNWLKGFASHSRFTRINRVVGKFAKQSL
ncbi:MAG TPA: B12-binding domain-containing radical SAM protein [Candidatus Brocadiia bacterium]